MKDITHLRSFAYDFYLREVQYFLGGRTSGLGPEYHITGFLHDFVKHFSNESVFARNCIHEGKLCRISTPREKYLKNPEFFP